MIRNYHHFADLSKRLSFNRDYLNTRLTYCKTALSKKGFEEYRKGNIDEAIGYWQDYLSIDPNNADIKKVVQTASAQRTKEPATKEIVLRHLKEVMESVVEWLLSDETCGSLHEIAHGEHTLLGIAYRLPQFLA